MVVKTLSYRDRSSVVGTWSKFKKGKLYNLSTPFDSHFFSHSVGAAELNESAIQLYLTLRRWPCGWFASFLGSSGSGTERGSAGERLSRPPPCTTARPPTPKHTVFPPARDEKREKNYASFTVPACLRCDLVIETVIPFPPLHPHDSFARPVCSL